MRDSQFSYDQIKDLVVSADVEGRQMHVVFGLPGSNETHEASVSIRQGRDVSSQVGRSVKRQAVNEVRRTFSRMLRGVFGGGFVGRTARQAFNTASREQAQQIMYKPSEKEKEQAIEDAFRRVSRNFEYNAAAGTWGAPGSGGATDGGGAAAAKHEPTPFEAHLAKHPVDSKFERDILARLLVHIAMADGSLADEEKEFFSSSIPEEIGTIESLAGKDPVSGVEAGELSGGVKETIYMLAWTISSIDMDTSPQETALLHEYREKFGLSESKGSELEKLAKFNVLDGYMTEDISREELFELGSKIGLSNDDAERAKIQWMKRQ